LDDEAIELIKDFEWVRFSVDAASREIYKKVKGLDAFERSIETIRKLMKVRSSNNVVGMGFIICPDNHKEIKPFVNLSKELGVDNVRFSLALTPKGDKLFDGIWDDIVQQLNEAKSEEKNDFKIFSFDDRIYDLKQEIRGDYCGFHHLVGVIAPRGVYPCCRLKDDFKFNFGDLRKQSFKEIWHGEKRKKFIDTIGKKCPYECWMASKNRFIEYIMLDEKPHKEFI